MFLSPIRVQNFERPTAHCSRLHLYQLQKQLVVRGRAIVLAFWQVGVTREERGRGKEVGESVRCDCNGRANLVLTSVHLHLIELPTTIPQYLLVSNSDPHTRKRVQRLCLTHHEASVQHTNTSI